MKTKHQYAIHVLELDRQYYLDDRETDPEDSEQKISELEEAIKLLKDDED